MEHRTYHLEGYLDFGRRKEVYASLLDFMERKSGTDNRVRVLEIGCAAGGLLHHLREGPLSIETAVGIDADIESLKHAQGQPVALASAFNLPFLDKTFDFVFMVSVLHHLVGQDLPECQKNWTRAIEEGVRVCRSAGYIMIKEGLAVRTSFSQSAIFTLTRFLAAKKLAVRPLRIERGEVLAFLKRSDLLDLCSSASGTNLLEYRQEPRRGSEFRGILRWIWQSQSCRLTAILQRK